MANSRRGDWMLTASGRQYWPLDPRAEDVRIEDITTALSKECRFGGHCDGFLSVAEHCVAVSHVVPPEHALQGLLHDATEAYCKDIPRPLKLGLGSAYADIEELNWLAICEALGVNPDLHPSVKAADNAVLAAEREQMMPRGGPEWSLGVEPARIRVVGYEWREARGIFLHRYYQLAAR